MKVFLYILLAICLLPTTLLGQIVYDTIPTNKVEIGCNFFENSFVFDDFGVQFKKYFDKVDLKNPKCYGKRVIVSTVFCKDGKIRNTKIVKPANPFCDSIAFKFVNGLNNWIPGLSRGRFVSEPFTLSIEFDSLIIKKKLPLYKSLFEDISREEFEKRKQYFYFVYNDSCQTMLNDFTSFLEYLKVTIEGNLLHISSFEYSRPKKNERVKITTKDANMDSINFAIYHPESPSIIEYIPAKEKWLVYWNKESWLLEPNFTPAKKHGKLFLEKGKRTILIGFEKGKKEPKLSICKNIFFENDTVLQLNLQTMTKNEFLSKLKFNP